MCDTEIFGEIFESFHSNSHAKKIPPDVTMRVPTGRLRMAVVPLLGMRSIFPVKTSA